MDAALPAKVTATATAITTGNRTGCTAMRAEKMDCAMRSGVSGRWRARTPRAWNRALAIAAAVGFCRERTGAVFAVSTWTGLAHLVAFVAATTAASLPLGLAGLVPWRLVFAAVLLVTLVYFAFADWLYMARLAGYVCTAETPLALLAPLPPIPPTSPLRVAPLQTTIDRDEPILSDVPQSSLLQWSEG